LSLRRGLAPPRRPGCGITRRDAEFPNNYPPAWAPADGVTAAFLARDGFTGAQRVLEGAQGMAAGMSSDANPGRLVDRLGARWALAETSFKFHASCRHTHPSADALLVLMRRHALRAGDIAEVVAGVHQAALDVLGPVVTPVTVHQAKFSMGTTLALLAVDGAAGVAEFERRWRAPEIRDFCQRVRMVRDDEVEDAYPARWIGKVHVRTRDGSIFDGRVDEPKGDPGNTLKRAELEDKTRTLAAFSGAAGADEVERLIATVWRMRSITRMSLLLERDR
jgi:2-methylcitrate dehydratase PrpD